MIGDQEVEVLKQKANFFCKNQQFVHVKFKQDFFKNGIITEVSDEFFMIHENKDGLIPIFYLEIRDIMVFKEKGK